MRTAGVATALTLILSACFLVASPLARANGSNAVRVSPEIVQVGINFAGANVHLEGPVPAGAQVAVKVSTEPAAVQLSRKGRVMGIFWMTTDRAIIENMPTFHAVYASQPVATLLSTEEQVRIGLDGECEGLMSGARVISASHGAAPLPSAEAREYVVGLRDMYIKNGRYIPCLSCHRTQAGTSVPHPGVGAEGWDTVRLGQGKWDLDLRLPADAPLGDYDVTAYSIQSGKVIDTQSAKFSVSKTGIVDILGNLATQNAPAYGGMSLAVVVLVGLTIGFIFPKGGGH